MVGFERQRQIGRDEETVFIDSFAARLWRQSSMARRERQRSLGGAKEIFEFIGVAAGLGGEGVVVRCERERIVGGAEETIFRVFLGLETGIDQMQHAIQ